MNPANRFRDLYGIIVLEKSLVGLGSENKDGQSRDFSSVENPRRVRVGGSEFTLVETRTATGF